MRYGRSASACRGRRVGRFGSNSKHTAAASRAIAAANINHQHLHTGLRLVRYVLPKYVCGGRLCHVAGKSAMQSELHYVAARLQAAVLTGPPSAREVTMTSTFRWVNSAAMSVKRLFRLSAHRNSMLMLRPSIHPSSRSRPLNGATHSAQAPGVLVPINLIVGRFPALPPN